MQPTELVDRMKAALHARADINNDGKLTRKDVEMIARQMATQAEVQTQHHPLPALIVAAVAGGFAGAAIRAAFGC